MTDYSAMVGFDLADGCPLVDGERVWDLKGERDAALARVKELEQERDASAERLAKVIGEREWLEQRVIKVIEERDAALAKVSELEKEREALRLRCEAVEIAFCNQHEQLMEAQAKASALPDLSQWPSGWAVGVEPDGDVSYIHQATPRDGWETYCAVTDIGTRLIKPKPVLEIARALHRALGRPCPWDEPQPGPAIEGSPGTKTVTSVGGEPWTISGESQPLALDEQVALLRIKVTDLEQRLDEMGPRKTEE